MDEASSRFVDQLVTNKLLAEKLSRVKHLPTQPVEALLGEPFGNWSNRCQAPIEHVLLAPHTHRLKSPVDCTHEANRWVPIIEHPVDSPRAIVLLIHGLFEDNRNIYGFLLQELGRLGYSVYLMTLPFHHERCPEVSAFSGEYFFSADLGRTKRAFRQAVLEAKHAVAWLKRRHSVPVHVAGFSMGGSIAFSLATGDESPDAICAINPAALLSELIWTSPLCCTIKSNLLESGLSRHDIDSVVETFDPTAGHHRLPSPSGVQMIFGIFDQVTPPNIYDTFAARFALSNVLRYKAGHLNMLRVPRLANDMDSFFRRRSEAHSHVGPQSLE